jgi:hypothetical protein
MRTVLSASLFALVLVGFSPFACATDASPEPRDATTDMAPEGDNTAPAAAESGKDDADGPAEDEPGSTDDVMKNFTRHRPGACPEGPPCKVED